MAAEHIFQDGRGVGQDADHDGNTRLLRDLERAVAEAVQLAGLARVALREYGDRGLVLLQELDGLEDGAQRRAVVFAVDRQAEQLTHDLGDHEEGEILLLGDEGQLVMRDGVIVDQRVEGEKMVGDEQKAVVMRKLLQTGHMNVNAAEEKRQTAELIEHEAEIAARLFQQLFRIDKARGNEQEQQKQDHEAEKDPGEGERKLPERVPGGKPPGKPAGQPGEHKTERKKDINHESTCLLKGSARKAPYSEYEIFFGLL